MYYSEMGNASQSKGFKNHLLKGGFPLKILEAKLYSSAPSCKWLIMQNKTQLLGMDKMNCTA